MKKPRVREAIIVEGRYDKNTVSQAVDALIVETRGFSSLGDRESIAFFRLLAMKRGVVILTDSDGAGFVIRGRLKGALPKDRVKHAYIPDIYGRERRKSAPSAEGKLGVEGMRPEVIVEALRRAGCTFEDCGEPAPSRSRLTRAGFIALGLSGGKNSAALRAALKRKLGFPKNMSSKALFEALSLIYSAEELAALISSALPAESQ